MRLLLLLIAIGLLGGTSWFAVNIGVDMPGLRGAPQIERMVNAAVTDELSDLPNPAVKIQTSGRSVTLSGPVESADKRAAVLAAAGGAYLVGRLQDRLVIVETVSPFTFQAVKAADGGISLSGHVPTLDAEDRILVAARGAAGGAPVRFDLTIAGGVPPGDWASLAVTGVAALGQLKSGEFALVDLAARLTGDVANQDAAAAITAASASQTTADWTLELGGLVPLADPYTFSALKTEDGTLIVDGHAPDAPTQAALMAAAQALTDQPLEGALSIAEGMPHAGWPDQVLRGLAALDASASGLLSIASLATSLTAEVESEADADRLRAMANPDWVLAVTVTNPAPQAMMIIILTPDGTMTADGVLPTGADPEDMLAALPGTQLGTVMPGAPGTLTEWEPAFEALRIVLPRLKSATAKIGLQTFDLSGALKRGFSTQGSSAAVRTVMPRDWTVSLSLTESAPLAEAVFSLQDGDIALTGLLPQGLTAPDALALLGDRASGEGLATGGEGDAARWRDMLTAIADSQSPFQSLTGRFAEQDIALNGVLRPGYRPNAVQDWLAGRMPEGWKVGLTAEETVPNEGDARRDLTTGERFVFRSGFWLPDLDFPVSITRCTDEAKAIAESQPVNFLQGSARIDDAGARVLDRLAAVALRCLNSSRLSLRILGHTDAQGAQAANQALSEARAKAVLAALSDRGVRDSAMRAEGLGESQPIADNDTAEGRAKNRRIEFAFGLGSP
ncbi:MAG: OmpA family protein [Pseudomonadota bacterium]